MNNKKSFLLGVFVIALVSFAFMVSAVSTLIWPVAGNYTTSINVSCTSGENYPSAVRFWYNATGGDVDTLFLTVSNTSVNQTSFNATSQSITSLTDGMAYNWSCESVANISSSYISLSNSTGNNVSIDNTAPTIAVYSGGTLTAYTNGTIKSVASQNLTLNISITDATIGLNTTSYFCFVDVNGTNQTATINGTGAIGSSGGGYCNFNTLNPIGLSDVANRSIKIFVNDSLNNVLLSLDYRFTLDTTAPVATAACSPSTVSTGDSFPCTCSTSDATSKLNPSSGGSTTSPDGISVAPSNTGTFTFTCSALDNGGLTASDTATYTVNQISSGTSSSSSGGSSSGSGTVASWVTHTISEDVFEKGQTRQLAASNRVQFTFGGESHHVGVISVSTDKVVIEIASDPVQVSLAPGEDAKVDLDNDGYYDVYVKLNDVVGSNADVTIQEIHELVPEGEGAVGTTGQIGTGEEETTAPEKRNSTWIWVAVIILVLIAVGYGVKRRSN